MSSQPSSTNGLNNMSSPSAASSSSSNNAGGSQPPPSFTHLSQLPPGMADFSSLNIHSTNSSAPASAASSPGWQHRRLPSSNHHTVDGSRAGSSSHTTPVATNSRVAASSITGKRLNWGEMICATIAHSDHGRLVIQDLFEQMCARFPEVQEWAFGKDWEARVKNRIKSTLSIKGHLFIKVPRPSTAAGKGSWWTLSREAQDAYRENRLAPLLKLSGSVSTPGHSRTGSKHEGGTQSQANSAAPSRYNSPGPASGAATPVKQHSMPHPLAQHVEAPYTPPPPPGPSAAAIAEKEQQAQRAAQLAQLQAHLYQQQQAQREALPGSYDPNAPPSSAAHFPASFWNFDSMGLPGGSVGPSSYSQQMSGDGTNNGASSSAQMSSTPSDQDAFLSTLQMYGSSFGTGNSNVPGGMAIPGKGRGHYAGNLPPGGEMDKYGGGGVSGSAGLSAGDPMSMSFDSGSFTATLRALGAATGWKGSTKDDGSGNGNATDSAFESSGGSSTSGMTKSSRGTAGTASSRENSYGVGSPQSFAHLGGPQSMPFPPQLAANAAQAGGRSRNPTGETVSGGNAASGAENSSPFDFNDPSSSGTGPVGLPHATPGPGGMFPLNSTNGSSNPSQSTGGGPGLPPDFASNFNSLPNVPPPPGFFGFQHSTLR